MKLNIEANDEVIDAIVIAAVQQSADNQQTLNEGDGYAEKYVAACALIIQHFGGEFER